MQIQSLNSLSFGPEGLLLVAELATTSAVAIQTGDVGPAKERLVKPVAAVGSQIAAGLKVKWAGLVVAGAVKVAPDARAWSFVPAAEWEKGAGVLEVDPLLEDLAGNNLLGPFEVDREAPVEVARTATVEFEIH